MEEARLGAGGRPALSIVIFRAEDPISNLMKKRSNWELRRETDPGLHDEAFHTDDDDDFGEDNTGAAHG